jgi:hypothetical protein
MQTATFTKQTSYEVYVESDKEARRIAAELSAKLK